MPIARCLIRTEPHYRRGAFEKGLQAAGYQLAANAEKPKGKSDLMIIWNRYGGFESMANVWESMGGTVLVAENGYAGKDANGHQLYALSAHGHNGSGWFVQGGPERLEKLGLKLSPWTNSGEHILVCGQRGIGSKTMASPPNWHERAARSLAAQTKRPIRIRTHPGKDAPVVPLEEDLKDAWACVIWSSSSGVKALQMGIPVFYDAPYWIAEAAALRFGNDIERPKRIDQDREKALQAMAWAQWTIEELESGEPFVRFRKTIESGSMLQC